MASSLRLALTLLAFLVGSCASTREPAGQELVGQWRGTNQSQMAQYNFAPDGTFTGTVTSEGRLIADFTGRWSLANGTLTYEYTGDKRGAIPAGTTDHDELLSVAADHYMIRARDGSERRYVRVAP